MSPASSRWDVLSTDPRGEFTHPWPVSQSSRFPPVTPAQKVCVIGAGSSGIASCQVLQARGVPFDCFEKGSGVGGNWRYENDNGMSSAYRSLHINTSRRVIAFRSLPMPEGYPDYPDHFQMA